MKILVLADNFTPEIAATSFRTHEHARHWLAEGHEVTVVTCVPNWPHGKTFPGYKNRLYQQEWIDGIRVIRVWSYMAANRGFLKRTLDYVSFMFSAVFWCWRYPQFDVILATSPQFFTAVAGWLVSILRRRPWIFELRDLWPESIKAVGAAQGRLIDWFERLELFLYRKSDRIVALTKAFRDNLIERGIPAAKIEVVTNGVDLERFHQGDRREDTRSKLGLAPDTFVAAYVGTTGMAHGLETILDAAELCRDDASLQFLIMGEGAQREQLESSARQRKLSNLVFADRVLHEEMPQYLAAIDLPIIHLKPEPLFRTVIPSKLFEFMAMGLPVLLAVAGESEQIVRDAGCGQCIPPGDAAAMASAVRRLSQEPFTLREMGVRGRQAVEQHYSRTTKARELLEVLLSVQDAGATPRRSVTKAETATIDNRSLVRAA